MAPATGCSIPQRTVLKVRVVVHTRGPVVQEVKEPKPLVHLPVDSGWGFDETEHGVGVRERRRQRKLRSHEARIRSNEERYRSLRLSCCLPYSSPIFLVGSGGGGREEEAQLQDDFDRSWLSLLGESNRDTG